VTGRDQLHTHSTAMLYDNAGRSDAGEHSQIRRRVPEVPTIRAGSPPGPGALLDRSHPGLVRSVVIVIDPDPRGRCERGHVALCDTREPGGTFHCNRAVSTPQVGGTVFKTL